MAAPLLRELLMGEPPLIDLVNRERRMKIRFQVVGDSPYQDAVLADDPVAFVKADGLSPRHKLPSDHVKAVTLDQISGEKGLRNSRGDDHCQGHHRLRGQRCRRRPLR